MILQLLRRKSYWFNCYSLVNNIFFHSGSFEDIFWSFLLIIAVMCIRAYFFLFFLFVICWAIWALELVTFNSFWKFSAIVSLKILSSPFYVIFLEIKHMLDVFHVILPFSSEFSFTFSFSGLSFLYFFIFKEYKCLLCLLHCRWILYHEPQGNSFFIPYK